MAKYAYSIAMIKHAMDVVLAAILKLNPEQTPVIAMDQPLYAIAKEIQWNMPDTCRHDGWTSY